MLDFNKFIRDIKGETAIPTVMVLNKHKNSRTKGFLIARSHNQVYIMHFLPLIYRFSVEA
jgi:hypothetical protein